MTIVVPVVPFANRVSFCSEGGWESMATARDRHYDTRSVCLVTRLVVAGLAPAMQKNDGHSMMLDYLYTLHALHPDRWSSSIRHFFGL
jgi:hypothetical protein